MGAAFAFQAMVHEHKTDVSPVWVGSNTNVSLNFTIHNNNSSNYSIAVIMLKDLTEQYQILNATCPINWSLEINPNSSYVICSTGIYTIKPGTTSYVIVDVTTTNITEGEIVSHNWTVSTTDGWGDPFNSKVTINIDNQKPNSTITTPSSRLNISCDSWMWINGTADDFLGSGVQKVCLSLDNGTTWVLTQGAENWSFNMTCNDGQYNIMSKAEDNVGLNETSSLHLNFTIDSTAPTININLPNETWHAGNITLNVTPSDLNGITNVYYRWSNSTNKGNWTRMSTNNTEWVSIMESELLADGDYTITFNASDYAGNIGTEGVNISLDNSGPFTDSIWLSKTLLHLNENITEVFVNASGKTNVSEAIVTISLPNSTSINLTLNFVSSDSNSSTWASNYTADLYGTYRIRKIYLTSILNVQTVEDKNNPFALKGVCGNGVCEPDESSSTCREDCPRSGGGGGSRRIVVPMEELIIVNPEEPVIDEIIQRNETAEPVTASSIETQPEATESLEEAQTRGITGAFIGGRDLEHIGVVVALVGVGAVFAVSVYNHLIRRGVKNYVIKK